MFRKLVASALFAGFAAGLVAALLQIAFVVPVILEAEKYETGTLSHFAGPTHAAEAGADAQEHAAAAPETSPPWARHLLTVLASAATFIGFALLLVAGFACAEMAGHKVSARAGLIWGLAGFLALQLLPAAGLAPELPGSAAGDLTARQVWWVATVVLSVAGLALIGFGRGWPLWASGAVLLLLPHLIGAPQPAAFAGVVPPELASDFAGKALAVAAVGWVLLGLFAGYFWQRESGMERT